MYDLLKSRAGTLATVVYSDRYFRYGLRLRARCPGPDELGRAPPPPPCHHVPLRTPAPCPAPPPPRLAAEPRAPPPPSSVLEIESADQQANAGGDPAARRRPLGYRQPAGAVDAGARVQPALGRRTRALRPERRTPESETEDAPRPQFALVSDAGPREEGKGGRPSYMPDRGAGRVLRRRVPLAERDEVPSGGRCSGGGEAGVGRQRAAVRVLMAASGLLYAAALLAFYFLSIA